MPQFIVALNAETVRVRYIDRRAAARDAFIAIANGAVLPDGRTIDTDRDTGIIRALTTHGAQTRGGTASDVYRLADGTLSDATDIARHRAYHGTLNGRALTDAKWRAYGRAERDRFIAAGSLAMLNARGFRADASDVERADAETVRAETAWRRMTGADGATADAVYADVVNGRYCAPTTD